MDTRHIIKALHKIAAEDDNDKGFLSGFMGNFMKDQRSKATSEAIQKYLPYVMSAVAGGVGGSVLSGRNNKAMGGLSGGALAMLMMYMYQQHQGQDTSNSQNNNKQANSNNSNNPSEKPEHPGKQNLKRMGKAGVVGVPAAGIYANNARIKAEDRVAEAWSRPQRRTTRNQNNSKKYRHINNQPSVEGVKRDLGSQVTGAKKTMDNTKLYKNPVDWFKNRQNLKAARKAFNRAF